jgi:LmbE family N-acetylglucosaminyl deacetylase
MAAEAARRGPGMMREYARRAYRTVLPMLYARTRYRLFLKSSFDSLTLRAQELVAATDYFSSAVRAIPIKAPFGKSMLVVAPHQDDESIGCGGALALQSRAGGRAAVVVVHDGGDGHDDLGMTRSELSELRNEESRCAAAVAGIDPPVFLGHSNLPPALPQAAAQLRALIEERETDAVFVPFMLDGHPDHRTTNRILAEALRTRNAPLRVFGYEVWGFCVPNVIVVIDDVMEQKLEMLRCFKFANSAIDYVHTTEGMNMYRSRMLGASECRYAECFFEMPREEYIQFVDHMVEAGSQPKP